MNTEALTIDQPVKKLLLPAEHIRLRLIRPNETYLLASRGSFKTSRALPLYVIDMVYEMPRSSGVIVGLSFEHLGDNTIPPFLQALEEFGFHHGEHYVYGKRPPAHWERPFLGVYNDKYDHVMTFHNGTSIHIVSLKKKASANGISAQWGVFDEVKFMDEKQLTEEIFPIFRGNEEYFKFSSGYLSKFFSTDKEADPIQIKWLLKKRDLQDQDRIAVVLTYQLRVNELKLVLFGPEPMSQAAAQKLRKEIDAIEKELSQLRSDLVYVGEINVDDIRPIMGDRWYDDKRRNSTSRVWKVSYKNEDPETAGEVFYPNFDKEVHTYSSENDINPSSPFIFSPDYQHSVAPIPICQLKENLQTGVISLNYVDEVYTLSQPNERDIQPNGNGSKGSLAEAVQLFCSRYQYHRNKTVYYVFDSNAKGKRVGVDEYFKIVVDILRLNKWRVIKIYTGKPPDHYKKFSNTAEWLKHSDKSLPCILINKDRCNKLIISISNSPAKTTGGKTEKDKELEKADKHPNVDQSETTHFSDCFDMINHAVLFLKKIRVRRLRR
jgi:hypothetical protein